MSCWEKGVEIPNSNCGFVLFFFFFNFTVFAPGILELCYLACTHLGFLCFLGGIFLYVPLWPCDSGGWAHDCSWLLCFFYAIVWGRAVGCLKTQGSDKQSIKDHGSQNRPNEGLRTSEGQSWDRPVSLVHLMFCPGQAIASVPVASGWVPLPVTTLGTYSFTSFLSFLTLSLFSSIPSYLSSPICQVCQRSLPTLLILCWHWAWIDWCVRRRKCLVSSRRRAALKGRETLIIYCTRKHDSAVV